MKNEIAVLAAIAFLAGPSSMRVWSQETNTIDVTDYDHQPVVADVFTVNGAAKNRVGRTSSIGRLTAVIDCKQGQKIMVLPVDDAIYYMNARTECPLGPETNVKVVNKLTAASLLDAAKKAENNNEYGKAVQLYNTIADQTATFSEPLSGIYRQESIENLGKALHVKNPINQNWSYKTVNHDTAVDIMSPAMKAELGHFQIKSGLEKSLTLDPATMEKIANKPHMWTR